MRAEPDATSSLHAYSRRTTHAHRYKDAGPAGQATFEAGMAGFEARAFRGCGVVTSEPFEVSDGAPATLPRLHSADRLLTFAHLVCADADSVQMLTRHSQVGEFYIMGPPNVPPEDGKWKNTLDMMIFDEEGDRHVRITWEEAVRATLAAKVAPNDALNLAETNAEIDEDIYMDDGTQLKTWATAANAWIGVNNGGSTPAASLKPVYIAVCRPFIEHTMHSAILAVNGADTGVTLFGPSDMQISVSCFPLTTAHLSIPFHSPSVSLCLSRQTLR